MLQKMEPKHIPDNVFSLLDERWALITAGDREHCNTMTASWGGLGVLWNRPVATIYVRPQRYTYQFTEKSDYFTLTFFAPGEGREALKLCGSKSGREVDKFAAAGLTPAFASCGAPYVAEGALVLVCRKLYAQDLEENCFLDPAVVGQCYPGRDFHRMYIGEILEAYRRD